jgi:hypothetical protein
MPVLTRVVIRGRDVSLSRALLGMAARALGGGGLEMGRDGKVPREYISENTLGEGTYDTHHAGSADHNYKRRVYFLHARSKETERAYMAAV